MKVWLNGHEWAKRQATKAGIGFTGLADLTAREPRPGSSAPMALHAEGFGEAAGHWI